MHKLLKQAFTLIELLVVIAIVGILSGLIVVSMSGVTQKANIAKLQVFSNSLKNSLMLNLISEWKFDELTTAIDSTTIRDSWSGGNNGILDTNILVADTADKVRTESSCVSGKCLYFDGVDDYVSVTDNASLNVTTALSIEIWINRIAVSAGPASLLRRDSSDTYAISTGGAGTTTVRLRFKDSASTHHYGTLNYVSTGQWNHIVGSYDGRYIRFYINGIIVSTDDIGAFTIVAGLGNLIIGRDDAVSGRFFNGLIDGVRIYNAAVPLSKIKENYYAGLNSLLAKREITKQDYQKRIGELAITQP